MDIESAIKFPINDENWIKKIVIGGILSLIPIVNLLVSGFYLKTMEKAINRSAGMPEWEGWCELFVKGLIGAIIAFIYLLIPTIVIAVMCGGAFLSAGAMGGEGAILAMFAAMFGGLAIGGILAIIFGFFIPMALAMYVSSNSIGSAFKIGELLSRIKSVLGDYLITYVVVIVLMIVLSVISAIPILGWIIAIFGGFYIGVVASKMFGEAYAASST
ncbi:MAG: hypothetical protein SYNGOMJ08_00452 [Candidatus Syntrophoarchaeum sp. GoM_oil]|nr:MAG: hypothetical protein SYNGOMJ08_00452 [Candidatus Syntrophoarchaeum sp. GoM_oil]